ncbi:unnamed protein product [Parnassius mnemosyne]|uniref:HAT C-terminal dimerisation domain-containing protein n=1 Tax=Parnassius mnemosyne TaxID=213953 RepID=A0AAV1L9C2_9NEOP
MPLRKQSVYKQRYKTEWEKSPNYKQWLKPVSGDDTRAMCTFCKKEFLAKISDIQRHYESANHKKQAKPFLDNKQTLITSVVQKPVEKTCLEAEGALAMYVAEHSSIQAIDHLTELCKNKFSDSKATSEIKMHRTKCTAVIQEVLAPHFKKNLRTDISNNSYSLIIDESTDVSVNKYLAVVVRYFDPMIGKVITRFWNLIQLFDEKTTDHVANAEKLFNTVIGSFQKYEIPTENIIGFGSDGCNTMMGCNNSVSSRFRQRCPGIIVIKCICHSLHLCASDACKELPLNCEKMARNIYNYFKSISKRQSELKEFQYFAEADVHKILRPAQTRWLSLNAVVQRILEQWDVLRLYFNSKWLEESECHDIHACLNDPIIKAYYYFLAWMLPKFTTLNSCFQSESILITKLHGKMTDFYKELLLLVLHRNYVNSAPIETIDPMTEINHKDLKDIYLGLGVQKELDSVENEERKLTLRKMCKNFIIRACVGLRKRYCFNDKIMTEIAKFDLEKVISDDREESVSSLFPLLPRIAPTSIQHQQELDDEWRKLPLYYKDLDLSQPPDVFWHQVAELRDQHREGNTYFQHLPKFMLAILSLPHSNAECERVFSRVNDIKTKKRNKLLTKSIKGNLLSQQAIQRHGKNCVDFNPTHAMIAKHNNDMYKNIETIILSDSD